MISIHVKEIHDPFMGIYRFGYIIDKSEDVLKRLYFDSVKDAVTYWDNLDEEDIVTFWDIESASIIHIKKLYIREEFHESNN